MVAFGYVLPFVSLFIVPMFRNSQKSITSLRVRAFMRALFGVFLFFYFYFLQSPLLSLAQLHLSEGKTIYYPLVSAVVLTSILLLVQKLVSKWIDFTESLYFFSYAPSVILAVLITAFTPTMNVSVLIFCAVVLVGFILASIISIQLSPHDAKDGSFAQLLATHALGMVAVLFSLGLFSNSNDITTYEIQSADLIRQMKYEEALNIGKRSLVSSPRLAALRAYALVHTEEGMGKRFFTYPLSQKGAEQLLFVPEDTLAQLLPPDSLYASLGVWRSHKETALEFFKRALDRKESTVAKDYWLVGLLLEKKLKDFASELSKCYPRTDSVALPRHYAEALLLYGLRHHEKNNIGDSVLLKKYDAYQHLSQQYSDSLMRRNQLYREFGNTYWWYYDYQN